MNWLRKHYLLLSILLFLIALNILFYFVDPKEIVDYVGIHNTYFVVLAIATIGGLSTFTGAVLYTSIATFAAGGANPLLLGLAGGTGIFISDSIFFYLAKRGRESVPESWEPWLARIEKFVKSYPLWIILLTTYLYLSVGPLPSDLLMVALVAAGIRYKELLIAIIPASYTIALITAYFGNLWA